LVVAVIGIAGVSTCTAYAQDAADLLRDWVTEAETQLTVNPLITFTAVAASPGSYRYTRAVRVSGSVREVAPATEEHQVYVAVATDCGSRLTLHTWEHSLLVAGMRIRAVVPAPTTDTGPGAPLVAIAWAPESVFTAGGDSGGVASDAGPRAGRLANPQPGTDPNVSSGPRRIQSAQGGGSTFYGWDRATGLPYYGPTQQTSGAAGSYSTPLWSPWQGTHDTGQYQGYAVATDEQAQFYAYMNLACYFNRSLSQQQAYMIVYSLFEACAAYRVPRPLGASLIYAESCFNPLDRSHAGAQGLTQLMPGTAAGLGVTAPYDIRQNVHGGMKYLAEQLARYAGAGWSTQVRLALAAYNAGPGAVSRAGGIPRNGETPPYVDKICRMYTELVMKGYR
jgi:hypothetical protein